jgi:hypothetical protein
MLKAILSFTVFGVSVCRSLHCMNARDDARWREGGSSSHEMGMEVGANHGMGEILLHMKLFCLHLVLQHV